MPTEPRDLATLRKEIDGVDSQLIALLNQRSCLVKEVGHRKALEGTPVYAPHREQAVLAKVLEMNASQGGPTPPSTIEAIYREIMSGSFALERGLRVGYLGPPGSYSHDCAVKQFGSSVAFENLRVIHGVFDEVARGNVDYGLVPVENTIVGSVAETLDAWFTFADKVVVCAEVALSVTHSLITCPGAVPSDIKEVRSKPEAIAQCRGWLARQYPQATLVPTSSSSAAVEQVAAAFEGSGSKHLAAIGSTLAARLNDLPILFTDIQDVTPNVTRFLVLCARGSSAATMGAPSGVDKTSLLLSLDKDIPGALARVLEVFQAADINLTHIDKRNTTVQQLAWLRHVADFSREGSEVVVGGGASPPSSPSGKGEKPPPALWVFFLELEGHYSDPKVAQAVSEAGKKCLLLKVLGSFPQARRVL